MPVIKHKENQHHIVMKDSASYKPFDCMNIYVQHNDNQNEVKAIDNNGNCISHDENSIKKPFVII